MNGDNSQDRTASLGVPAQAPSPTCCAANRTGTTDASPPSQRHGQPQHSPSDSGPTAEAHREVRLAGGEFEMGDHFGEGYPADGEQPVHRVRISPFALDQRQVTNAMFAHFIKETGYRTESERYGSSPVFHLLVRAPQQDLLGRLRGAEWWVDVRGADWAHPTGRNSSWQESPDHPVVHVSWNDAQAYCAWAGRRLPTEAEWEFAARGGLQGRRYAWGDELTPEAGEHRCNIWQGQFPSLNTAEDGHVGTAPAGSFPPNDYGLQEMAGNVWEWCQDWFHPKYYRISPVEDPPGPPFGPGRVMRGGSYLCHASYCNRYRVSARTGTPPESASGNCGFRTARSL